MNLKEKPFCLKDDEILYIENLLQNMTIEEKIGQLFCPIGHLTDKGYLNNQLLRWHIGGLFFREGNSLEMRDTFEYAQNHSRIPLLIPSNLETGGDGATSNGTHYGRQMSVAAANDKKYAYLLGKIACSEGASIGINWAFAPVVDIDLNYHNPITNVRTFGSDPKKVSEYASEYIKAAKECNVATSVKHFPGDGVDERDQHLLTSVNSLSMEEWDKKFGKIYEDMIEAGTMTVMAGHIAMPAYQNFYDPKSEGKIIPATLSKPLLNDLLRQKLKFNGLIVTDATPMVGFTSALDRETAVPLSIENGCDMFLFNKDLEEDYKFMMQGYHKGILSEKRLIEANTRLLALKMALGLFKKADNGSLIPKKGEMKIIGCDEHIQFSKELADLSITLVKDTQLALPISPEKSKRILLEVLGGFSSNERVINKVKNGLTAKGFEVTLYEKEDFTSGVDNVTIFKTKYDMVIYLGNVENASNQTTNRINWYTFWGSGNNVPWFTNEVPVIFISVINPYHLLDVPMVKTYINCYSNSDVVLDALVGKLVGNSEFKGVSPVDPFCGRIELKY